MKSRTVYRIRRSGPADWLMLGLLLALIAALTLTLEVVR